MEYNADCDFDYVEVHSGISPSSEVLRRVCGGNASSIPPLISKSNKMQVKFHTDTFQNMRGFKAVYETGIWKISITLLYFTILNDEWMNDYNEWWRDVTTILKLKNSGEKSVIILGIIYKIHTNSFCK